MLLFTNQSNIIYIGFQNSYSFFEVFFDEQLFFKGSSVEKYL